MNKIFLVLISFLPIVVFAEKTVPDAPIIESVSISQKGENSFLVNYIPSKYDGGTEIVSHNIYFRLKESGDSFEMGSFGLENNFNYSNPLINSKNNYEVYITAVNVVGESLSSNVVFTDGSEDPQPEIDKEAPIISNLDILNISKNEAEISWTTDELAYSAIAYDVHSVDQHHSYMTKFLSKEHSFNLTDLLPCTTYFYYVVSYDEYENISTSDVKSFDTIGCLGGVLSKEGSELIPPQVLASFKFNDSIDISVKEGAFGADSVFQVKRLNIKDVDDNVGCPVDKKPIGGRVYDIKFLDDFNSEAILSSPATISMKYEEEEIIGIKEEDISMYHYNEDFGAWQKLDSCVLDTENNTVTCTTDGFSKFMLSDGLYCPKSSWFFNRYMFLGSIGKQVRELQKYLNDNGYFVSYEGRGAPGMETSFFGLKTRRALKNFQREYFELFNTKSLEYRLGIFGKQTKDLINP